MGKLIRNGLFGGWKQLALKRRIWDVVFGSSQASKRKSNKKKSKITETLENDFEKHLKKCFNNTSFEKS